MATNKNDVVHIRDGNTRILQRGADRLERTLNQLFDQRLVKVCGDMADTNTFGDRAAFRAEFSLARLLASDEGDAAESAVTIGELLATRTGSTTSSGWMTHCQR